jgi:GT2 family glycosyltransferase
VSTPVLRIVVVLYRQRLRHIRGLLRHLTAAELPAELILDVIINRDVLRTARSRVRRLSLRPGLALEVCCQRNAGGVAAAYNFVLGRADADDVLILLDGDSRPPPEYFSRICELRGLLRSSLVFACPQMFSGALRISPYRLRGIAPVVLSGALLDARLPFGDGFGVINCCLSGSVRAFREVDGFRERLGLDLSDVAWSRAAARHDAQIVLLPLSVPHDLSMRSQGFSRARLRRYLVACWRLARDSSDYAGLLRLAMRGLRAAWSSATRSAGDSSHAVAPRDSPNASDAATCRIAVIVCTHNGERFITEQLDSIETQSAPVHELHIFDWSSTDGTARSIQTWAGGNERRREMTRFYPMTSAPGPARSFLHALDAVARSSAAELILLADQDDVWSVDKVHTFLQQYTDRAGAFDLAYSDARVLRANGELLPSFYGPGSPYRRPGAPLDKSALLTNPAIGMTMCLRRAWLMQVRAAFDLYWLMHDWALLILAWLTGARVRYLDAPLVTYRQHGQNVLGAWAGRSMLRRAAGAGRHIRNVRRQLQSAVSAAAMLAVSQERAAELATLERRIVRVRAAADSSLLSPRYRVLLALSFLMF